MSTLKKFVSDETGQARAVPALIVALLALGLALAICALSIALENILNAQAGSN